MVRRGACSRRRSAARRAIIPTRSRTRGRAPLERQATSSRARLAVGASPFAGAGGGGVYRMAPRKAKGVMLVENLQLHPHGGLACARRGDLPALRRLVEEDSWDAHRI
eukprot:scaffold8147_cov296-Prasinococcus_capsulatus_cf.AAC.3